MRDQSCPSISVIVPTRSRPQLLDRCLQALREQDNGTPPYEVIVVDDSADGSATHTVTRWSGFDIPVRYLRSCESGPAAARNCGWRAAAGAIIAFTDDDCIPEPDWLARGVTAFGPDVAAVSGRIVVPSASDPTDYQSSVARLEEGVFVTANSFYRRETLERFQGFDERFTMAWREDTDLYLRMVEAGMRLAWEPDAVVVHPIRPSRFGVSMYQQRKSIFNALLYKKHPRLYRERVQTSPPWTYYLTVIAAIASVVSLFRGRPVPARRSALLWLLLTTRFCLRRLRFTSHRPTHVAEMVITSVAIPFLAVFWRLVGAVKFRVWFL